MLAIAVATGIGDALGLVSRRLRHRRCLPDVLILGAK